MNATSSDPAAADDRLQSLLGALGSPVRREILWLTRDAEMPAREIARHFRLAGPTVSEHLRVLRRAGLVTQRRLGTSRLYRADVATLRAIQPLVREAGSKWLPADDIAERSLAGAELRPAVVVGVDVSLGVAEAFASFATGERWGAWLGVPVAIDAEGRFSTTLEWGTEVRGRYEVVVPPNLIAMRWDFDDQALPVPGAEQTAYLRFSEAPNGTHVEAQQWAQTDQQARFLADAWRMVLGRFAAYGSSRIGPSRRPARPKRRPERR